MRQTKNNKKNAEKLDENIFIRFFFLFLLLQLAPAVSNIFAQRLSAATGERKLNSRLPTDKWWSEWLRQQAAHIIHYSHCNLCCCSSAGSAYTSHKYFYMCVRTFINNNVEALRWCRKETCWNAQQHVVVWIGGAYGGQVKVWLCSTVRRRLVPTPMCMPPLSRGSTVSGVLSIEVPASLTKIRVKEGRCAASWMYRPLRRIWARVVVALIVLVELFESWL